MKLHIMRHGDALSGSQNPSRPLSVIGIKDVELMAKNLNLKDCDVWHSPVLRAQQTAKIVAPNATHLEKEYLTPDAHPEEALNDLMIQEKDLLIVSHIPFVENLLFSLRIKDLHDISFDTATVVSVERSNTHWNFLGTKSPKDFSN